VPALCDHAAEIVVGLARGALRRPRA
jgi:hypothetical protein